MNSSLHVDWTRCDGRGLCTELLASVLMRDDWGYPISRRREAIRGEVSIAPEQEEAAREAVILCPKLALTLRPPAKSD
ncbi:ferredoxin [Arthrobacter sp. NPDC055138]